MGTLDQALNEGKLDEQREVVKNERRQGIDNPPYGRWMERSLAHVYPEGHPYRTRWWARWRTWRTRGWRR